MEVLQRTLLSHIQRIHPCVLAFRKTAFRPLQCVETSSYHFNSSLYSTTPQTDIVTASKEVAPNSSSDYTRSIFTDKCLLTVHSGAGGHGCVSFLREKFLPDGPPNGGDGGYGGSVYIQAVASETSLYKLSRRRHIRAGRGRNGQGRNRGGERGDDVVINVPIGTTVREVSRIDPVEEEDARLRAERRNRKSDSGPDASTSSYRTDRWLLYPGGLPSHFDADDLPPAPRPQLLIPQPPPPIELDLMKPTPAPILVAVGAPGGLGNSHFLTSRQRKPKFASKGFGSTCIVLSLELKILADVGLVGLPNAGKSTLLRALTRSRARVGDWPFTTLVPNIGTVVLDTHVGRVQRALKHPRDSFSVADIPGLIEDAHLDKGLGMEFLRHVERAKVLTFVVDLTNEPIHTLTRLWKEVAAYEAEKERQLNEWSEQHHRQTFAAEGEDEDETVFSPHALQTTAATTIMPPISSKAWLVVATKADLPETAEAFSQLQDYVQDIAGGRAEHPSTRKNAWLGRMDEERRKIDVVPVSAIREKERSGVERVIDAVLAILDS